MKFHSISGLLLTISLLFISSFVFAAKTSTQTGNGNWDTGANWGGTAPSPGTWEAINVGHSLTRSAGWSIKNTMTITSGGNATFNADVDVAGGSNLLINSGGTLTVNGNFNHVGSSVNVYGTMTINGNLTASQTFNVYGTLRVTGNLGLTGNFRVHPGGLVIIDTDVSVTNSQYLKVGTAVAPPLYADMIVKGNINTFSSGDILVDQNGRLAVYGDVNGNTGGGTLFTINNGGEVFIGGNLNYPGGGDAVTNNNSGGNIGLYIDGTVSVSSGNIGGAETSGGYASSDYLGDTEGGGSFYSWLTSIEESPLPVELISFNIEKRNSNMLISWKTGSEIDNDFFTIEKSIDGKYFNEIAIVEGNGSTSDIHDYSFTDFNVNQVLTYYRLSQTDYDGTNVVLAMKAVHHSAANSKTDFYPNLVNEDRLITFHGLIPERMLLLNQSGQVVLDVLVWNNQIELPESLNSGNYFMKTISVAGSQTHRLIIQ